MVTGTACVSIIRGGIASLHDRHYICGIYNYLCLPLHPTYYALRHRIEKGDTEAAWRGGQGREEYTRGLYELLTAVGAQAFEYLANVYHEQVSVSGLVYI